MKYSIDTDVALKYHTTLKEVFATLSLKTGADINDTLQKMVDDGKIVRTVDGYMLTQGWSEKCDNILLDSDGVIPKTDELYPLAEKLMAIAPQGKMYAGSPYYWKCNKREVAVALQRFYKMFGRGYSEEQIIEAYKKYVASFNGQYTGMRILKYAICKKIDGEYISELSTFLENKDNDVQRNWIDDLR